MHKALTEEHSRPGEVPTAGAAPVVPGAIPAATPAAPATSDAAPVVPGPGGPRVPGEGRGKVSRAGAATGPAGAVSVAKEAAAATREEASAGVGRGPGRMGTWSGRLLAGVIALGILVVAGVGFAASYDTLREAAEAKGFSHALSYWVPIAIDGAILAFLGLDLYFTHRRIPKPLLRFAAHGMTLATVVLNSTSGGQSVAEDPVRAFWHGLMPVLFVIGVEALRHAVLHAAQIEAGTATDRIPLHRWALAPVPTARLYRRMRLAGVRSYDEMIRREQDLEGYRVWLKQELGGNLSKATDEQLLPLTMAPKGFTVDQALALPAQWEAEAAERARAEEERQALAEAEDAERAAKLEIRKLESAGRVEAARHRVTAETGTAAAEADATTERARAEAERVRVEAERVRRLAELTADIEAEAWQKAETAAALRKAKEDELAAAKAAADAEAERRRQRAERQAADLEAEAVETERAAEARRKAAAAARKAKEDELAAAKAEADARAERTRAAEAEKEEERHKAVKAQAIRDAQRAEADAETERARAAEARRWIAVLEAEAATADDYADLTPRQRKARKVARMILAAGGDAERVKLSDIEAAVGVGRTVAGDIRKEAQELLAGGYDPTTTYIPQTDR
ncbi:DUF2637 domain-containing protein [Streptomyces sp. NPDC049744]|uniref:DUF2637 domain-containing protein n=1 Tax=Streptomyces sp. NPDC049744 TaxID=3154359 RepID=UPI00343B0BB2